MLSSKNTKNTEELVNPPVVEKDAGTKTEEVKGDVGSQTITKVEAIFKVLEDEKFALGNEIGR
ncbi:MAG TPA: hypothetical protein DEQ74_00370, partial [Wolbachia sp.]|nr:hypothetical protein [Wolbachia sp.]